MPQGEVKSGFKPFQLKLDTLRYPPVSDELWIQHLRTNQLDVHISIYEGDQFHLGRLEFGGNTTTKDKVLRREIFIEEGDVMDMEAFKQSIYKLGQLGYFKASDNPDFKVNPDKKTVDVTIKGDEQGKNDVQFGGGYSEGGGAFIQTSFSTRNFLGEGENLGLAFQRGNRQNYFSLSYSDPWFLDTPNSLGASIFDRNTTYPLSVGYQERSKGGSLVYGYRLHRFDSFSFAYGLEHLRQHTETVSTPDENGNVPIAVIQDEDRHRLQHPQPGGVGPLSLNVWLGCVQSIRFAGQVIGHYATCR